VPHKQTSRQEKAESIALAPQHCDEAQTEQAPPFAPHAEVLFPTTHVLPSQQPWPPPCAAAHAVASHVH
jgi:hypothetical protein